MLNGAILRSIPRADRLASPANKKRVSEYGLHALVTWAVVLPTGFSRLLADLLS